MEHSLRIEQGILVATTSGPAEADGWTRLHEAILAEPGFVPGMPILIDHTALDTNRVNADVARTIGELVRAYEGRESYSRIAIVAPETVSYGFARMVQARADAAVRRTRVFWARDDALRWLTDTQTDAR